MAANISQHRRRAEVMTSPIATFAGWSFMATCPTCRVRRYVDVDSIVHQSGGEHLVQSVVNRLRYGTPQCGRAPSFVRLQSRPDYAPGRPIRELILVGAGAF